VFLTNSRDVMWPDNSSRRNCFMYWFLWQIKLFSLRRQTPNPPTGVEKAQCGSERPNMGVKGPRRWEWATSRQRGTWRWRGPQKWTL